MSVRPGKLTILRDAASFIGGWALIFKQAGIFFAPPSQPSEFLIGIAALIIGVPGVAHIVQARFGVAPTGSASSPPPGPASSALPSGDSSRNGDQ